MTVCSKTVEIPVALLFVMGVLRLKHISFGRIAGSRGPSQAIITFLLLPCCLPLSYRAPPLIQDSPFIWGWNAPTELCAKRFNVTLDLRFFDFIGSPRKEMKGQNITIFYEYRLGHYPYIDETTSKLVNGGIPQEADLRSHLIKAENDISCCMNDNQIGLAVIDWENWRPLWDRNWKPKDIYRNASVAVVQKRNANLDINEVTKIAKNDFETAAKNFMEETIKLGRLLQPSYLWGYYLFPECYNSHYRKPGYDGSCPEIEMRRNDHLHWLWKESTALYPSIYLNRFLQSSALTPLYVRHRVLEAVRISKAHHDKNPLPVFIYTRPVLTDRSLQFLAQDDFVNTYGEMISLGASGAVLWGTLNLTQNVDSCKKVANFTKTTLNHYIINATLAAKMCSQVLCYGQGVCTRKQWNSSDYLHLNPENFVIETDDDGQYTINGKPTLEDLQQFSEKFSCTCYSGIKCTENNDLQSVSDINVCVAEVCISTRLNGNGCDALSICKETTSLVLFFFFFFFIVI